MRLFPKAIRWSGGADRYFGPFTYTPNVKSKRVGIMLGSGCEEYPGCRLRLDCGSFTLHVALPQIIKPCRRWHEITTEPTRSQMIERGRKPGYYESHSREFGFIAFEGAVHYHYGPQTCDSSDNKSRCWFYPWLKVTLVRHSIYKPNGEHFADLPLKDWLARYPLIEACPVQQFRFRDFDGEEITATCQIQEREYRRGKGLFKLLLTGRNHVYRDFDIKFSSEVGRRKGSWKGGTIGHSGDIRKGETLEMAFRRYCAKQELMFLAEQVQA